MFLGDEMNNRYGLMRQRAMEQSAQAVLDDLGFNLPAGARLGSLTIGQLMLQRLGGHAEYADRVTLGTIELIVRDVDDDGKITSVGLSFEPAPAVASIPAFLSPAELIDRVRAFLKRPAGAAGTDGTEEPAGKADN